MALRKKHKRQSSVSCAKQIQRRMSAKKVGGWTETRPFSLGLLPSGSDPVGEWYVHHQPPAPSIAEGVPKNKSKHHCHAFFASVFGQTKQDWGMTSRPFSDTHALGSAQTAESQ